MQNKLFKQMRQVNLLIVYYTSTTDNLLQGFLHEMCKFIKK